MLKTRVIPSLLIQNSGLVKTVQFKNAKYVGDPINAIKIFNEKEVDELAVLDISATKRGAIDYELLSRINKEAFMPLSYGGGIRTPEDVQRILSLGYEKVVLNTGILDDPDLIGRIAAQCGSQSIMACVDAKKDLFGYHVYDYRKMKATKTSVADWCKECQDRGAGEILLHNVDREGTYQGYDANLLQQISERVSVPLIALGGAGKIGDLKIAVDSGASAVAAGSIFVFYGPHRAVLITYPKKAELKELFKQ
jgi:cyclase